MRRITEQKEEVFRAWARGETVQRQPSLDCWKDWGDDSVPPVADGSRWRIKPEPKPDIVHLLCVSAFGMNHKTLPDESHNLIVTFDGETGKLKKAEVI